MDDEVWRVSGTFCGSATRIFGSDEVMLFRSSVSLFVTMLGMLGAKFDTSSTLGGVGELGV